MWALSFTLFTSKKIFDSDHHFPKGEEKFTCLPYLNENNDSTDTRGDSNTRERVGVYTSTM